MLKALWKFYLIVTPLVIFGSIIGGGFVGGITEGLRFKHTRDLTFLMLTVIFGSLRGAIAAPIIGVVFLLAPLWAPPFLIICAYTFYT